VLSGAALLGITFDTPASDEGDAVGAARWSDLQQALFYGRQVADADGIIQLDVSPQPADAAQVPVAIQLTSQQPVKGIYLVIDDNPEPLAAHITFGPQADVHNFKLNVRVNQHTNVHAVAETQDGQLHAAAKPVEATGGYSAPAGTDDSVALKDVGQMKLRLSGALQAGKPLQAQLLIRHPNFNGRQLNPLTHYYVPAYFIRTIDVTYEGGQVLRLESDISLSTDPVITFGFVPAAHGHLRVVVKDSAKLSFDQSFDVPPH
jgi:sulfur-oxidizing protein SoxY